MIRSFEMVLSWIIWLDLEVSVRGRQKETEPEEKEM